MRSWSGVIVAATLVVAACWRTKSNPDYCDTSASCTADPLKPLCDPVAHACVGSDVDLGSDGPPPDLYKMCTASSECSASPARFCDPASNKCRPCIDADCTGTSTPLCAPKGPLIGACVVCVDESACAGISQVCDAAKGVCMPCSQHDQCGSGVCDAGTCVADTSIAYVDINQSPCTGADGSKNMAFCDVNAGIAKGRPFVHVAGSAMTYPAFSIGGAAGANVTIVGPGKAAAVKAQFSQNNLPSVAVAPTGGAVTVTLDGLELIGSAVGSEPAVKCAPTAGTVNLTVRDCYIHTSGGIGVDSNACALTLSRNFITDNKGGVTITGGSFDIQNNLIYLNLATAAPALTIGAGVASSSLFRFNTLAKNTNSGGVGGVICVTATELIDSILMGNSGATQTTGCTLTRTATGGTDGVTGNFAMPPTFVDAATDFHLKLPTDAATKACCIDKAGTTPTPPALDVDGTARPKGAAPDVGAHEAE